MGTEITQVLLERFRTIDGPTVIWSLLQSFLAVCSSISRLGVMVNFTFENFEGQDWSAWRRLCSCKKRLSWWSLSSYGTWTLTSRVARHWTHSSWFFISHHYMLFVKIATAEFPVAYVYFNEQSNYEISSKLTLSKAKDHDGGQM